MMHSGVRRSNFCRSSHSAGCISRENICVAELISMYKNLSDVLLMMSLAQLLCSHNKYLQLWSHNHPVSLMCMHVFAFCTHLFVLNPPSGILIVPFLFEQHSKPLVPVCNVWFNGIHLKTTAACQNDWMLRLHLPRHLSLMDITFEFPTTLTWAAVYWIM